MSKPAAPRKQPRLQVFLDHGPVAASLLIGECLWVPSRRAAAFEWSRDALAAGLDLSPLKLPLEPGVHLADHDPFSGIHPLFSDSIPDGFGLRLMNKGLQAAGYDLDQVNPLHRLAWVGERGAGALSYKPVIDAKVDPLLVSIFDAASMAASAEVETFQGIPKEAIRAGGSALGARPKFWGAIGPDGKHVMLGDWPSCPEGYAPVLLKFAPARGDKNEPFFEAACLALANKHGVNAAQGRLLSHPGGAALAIQRFDRLPSGERIHTQSVAALLGINFREPQLDYDTLAKLARGLGGTVDVERVYRQLCFNVALSMRDDHAKNFAFCLNSDGQWSLSPAFDLCPSAGIGLTQEHTTTVHGKGRDIGRSDLEAFALAQGLTVQIARDGVDHARAAATEFAALAVSLGATQRGVHAWTKVFKAIDRQLRSV